MIRFDINDIRKRVKWTGGDCLTKVYVNDTEPLKWRCKKGHTWENSYRNVRAGQWCAQCNKQDAIQYFIKECIEYARSKGGKFLSPNLTKKKEHAKWRCANGHEWLADAATVVLRESWCRKCAFPNTISIDDALKIIKDKKGICLSSKMEKGIPTLKVQCNLGHIWNTTTYRLHAGNWCMKCSMKIIGLKRRIPYSLILDEIKSRKGKLLISENEYNDSIPLVTVKCANGHIWKKDPYRIVRLKMGCPKCETPNKPTYDIDDFKLIAKKNGAECLSTEYHGQRAELKFKCKKGHIFISRAINVKRKFVCHECEGREYPSIQVMQKLAAEKDGWCLSKKYVSLRSKLKWKCKKGHIWNSTPATIKRNAWCPVCAGTLKFTLPQVKKMGAAYKCKLLSKVYVRASAPLKWSCREGHVFKRSLNRLRFLNGCPECRKQIRYSK